MTDVREHSGKMLTAFLVYCGKQGIQSFIVGGWAVYAFTQKEKSVDVDVVFADKAVLKDVRPFFSGQGFGEHVSRKGEVSFEKTFSDDGKTVELVFEVFFLNERNAFAENREWELPWHLAVKHSVLKRHGQYDMRVPCAELLLLYKLKAYRDRTYRFYKASSFLKPKQRARLAEKIDKDKRDCQSLIAEGVDADKLRALMEEIGLSTVFKDALKEMGSAV